MWILCGIASFLFLDLDLRYCDLRLSSRNIRLEKMVPTGVRLGAPTQSSSARRVSNCSREHPHFRAIIS